LISRGRCAVAKRSWPFVIRSRCRPHHGRACWRSQGHHGVLEPRQLHEPQRSWRRRWRQAAPEQAEAQVGQCVAPPPGLMQSPALAGPWTGRYAGHGSWHPAVGSASTILSSCDSRGTPLGVTLTGVSPSTRHSPTSSGIRVSPRRHQHCRSTPTTARPVQDGPVPIPQQKSRAGRRLNQGLGVGTQWSVGV
jgi:hypothetical protein